MNVMFTPENLDWDNEIAPGEFAQLPADGYICKIIDAKIETSKNGNLMIVALVDINEGEFAGYFQTQYDRFKNSSSETYWSNNATYRKVIFDKNDKVDGHCTHFLKRLMQSNPGFNIDYGEFDAATLKGKICGFVFGEEEYTGKKDGILKKRAVVRDAYSADEIREGKFKVPKLKRVDSPAQSSTSTVQPKTNADNVDLEDPPF